MPKNAKAYMCSCGKCYKHSSSLSGHKQKCDFFKKNEEIQDLQKEIQVLQKEIENNTNENKNTIVAKDETDEINYKELCMNMVDVMKEQQKQMGEILPKIGNHTTTNNFNLNVFLNEDCKDALNIMDFVKSLQIQIEDLVTTGKIGFVESTSQLLIKNLNELEVTKRPIHCSDLKRETLYIKDNDVWEKETENKDTMKRAVKYLQKESFGVIPDWVKEHPGCARGDNRHNDEYMEIVGNTAGVDTVKDVNKIVKKVAKEVIIDKKNS
jgi:cell division septum initiation protein DivIVA